MNNHSLNHNKNSKFKNYYAWFPFILVFYEITNYLANDMYLPALPDLASDLKITAHVAQQTLTTFFLGASSLQLFLGPLSDRLGRRPILLGGGFVFIMATLICALTPSIQVLLIARFFQGCAICVIGTAGYSSIHEIYESIKAIKILSIMGSITVLAPAFGPLFGGVILQWFSWRWIFGLLVIWALIGLIGLWFFMPESNPKEKRHPLQWQSTLRNYLAILLNAKFTLNVLIVCLAFLGMIAWIAAGPFLVIEKFHYNTLVFGVFQIMVFGSLIVGAQVVKYVIDRMGPKRLINLGLMISSFGSILAFVLTFLFPNFLLGLVISLMIFSFGSSLAFGPLQRMAIDASTEPMGARMAIFSTLFSLSGFIGGLLVSLTYTETLLWFGILLIIISGLIYLTKGFLFLLIAPTT